MSTPLLHYQRDLNQEGFSYDPAQEMAVAHLQDLYDRLVEAHELSFEKKSLFQRLAKAFSEKEIRSTKA